MNKKVLILCAGLFLMLVHTGRISAACWQIDTRDGIQIKVTDFWNLSSKLEESPQNFLLGRVEGEEQQIPIDGIESILYQSSKEHGWRDWLKGSDSSAQIRFTDGSVRTLVSGLPVFYRTMGKKKHLPASTVMGGRADNRDMDLNIFYRAKGKVKQLPVNTIAQIERCNEKREPAGKTDITVQQVKRDKHPGQPEQESQPEHDVVEMANGDMLTGRVTTTPIRWKTDYGVLEISRDDIRSLAISVVSNRPGKLELLSGDHLGGHLLNETITIHLSIGQSLDIPAAQLRGLTLHATVSAK